MPAAIGITARGGTANAEDYVDYQYAKGVWDINQIEVDASHIEDYLTGLKQSQVGADGLMPNATRDQMIEV